MLLYTEILNNKQKKNQMFETLCNTISFFWFRLSGSFRRWVKFDMYSHRPELSSVVGLRGCVKGFQFQKKDFNLLEEPGTIGISSGCPEESFVNAPSTNSHTDSDNALCTSLKSIAIRVKHGWHSQIHTWKHTHTHTLTVSWKMITNCSNLTAFMNFTGGVRGAESKVCFYCARCPVKPISLERVTWDPQQRFHRLTTLREVLTSEHCSPVDSCSTTVKG